MAVFDFPFHTFEDQYPVSSAVVQFGGGYSFASKPRGPDQVVFKLNFKAMWYFETTPGVVNATTEPKRNMKTLIDFYETHRLYEPFTYPHPVRGNVTVRFNKPLGVPKGVEKGGGQVEGFQVELVLQP